MPGPTDWLPRFDPDDPDGLDLDFARWLSRPVSSLLSVWHDFEVQGLDNVPDGPALMVGNHNSGAMFIEMFGFGASLYQNSSGDEAGWHGLTHDNIIGLPIVGRILHRLGAIRAGHGSAAAAFARGRKVVVCPGGNREAFRPFRDRYEIALGDRRGFVRLALRHEVPIVPVVFIGGHSGLVILSDNKRLARFLRADKWLRSDTWPLMVALPWGLVLGPMFHLPMPVGCITSILAPIAIEPYLEMDPDDAVERLFRAVEAAMQEELTRLAAVRRQRPWPLRRRSRR